LACLISVLVSGLVILAIIVTLELVVRICVTTSVTKTFGSCKISLDSIGHKKGPELSVHGPFRIVLGLTRLRFGGDGGN